MIKMLIKCLMMMVGVKASGDQFFVKEFRVFRAFSSRFALLRIHTVEFWDTACVIACVFEIRKE